MVMNIAANMLGLGNAATPLGLRAMGDLERLNPHPGTATNAMCTFLAINTSSVQLIPATAVAILAANKGSKNPDGHRRHVAVRHVLRLSGGHHGGQDAGESSRFLQSRRRSPDTQPRRDHGPGTSLRHQKPEPVPAVPPMIPGGWAISWRYFGC